MTLVMCPTASAENFPGGEGKKTENWQ